MPLLQLGYKRIHYTDYAPTTTTSSSSSTTPRTIICHHGLGSSQNFYTPLVPALTAAGFRVITFDATGAARSPYTQVEQSVPTLAADVVGLLDALGVGVGGGGAVVVGHSMGGIVAAHLAAAAATRDRVAAVVLLGPVYPGGAAVADVFAARIAAVARDGMAAVADTVPYAALAAGASALARAFVRELLLAQGVPGYLSHCRVICGAARPAYEAVRAPVLLLAGAEDRSASLGACERMFGELGSVAKRMEVLDGVGHWHCVEAPEVVGEKMVAFLRGLEGGRH